MTDLLSGCVYRFLESRRDVCLATTACKVIRSIYEYPQVLDVFGLLAPSNYLRALGRDLFLMPVGITGVIVRHLVTRSIGMLSFVHRVNDFCSIFATLNFLYFVVNIFLLFFHVLRKKKGIII